MPKKKQHTEVPVQDLRWTLDPATLPFDTTDELKPLKEIIGQKRGVEAFKFGMGINKKGYNVFVTGQAGTGRLSTTRRLLEEMTIKGEVPHDLCYVNNFENPEAPILLTLDGGKGNAFKKDVHDFVETLKKLIPQLFESQEYINTKKEIMEAYETKGKGFFKSLDEEVKKEGFTLVDVQVGQIKRPEVMPLVDGNPTPIDQVEAMVEKGRFPKEEFEALQEKHVRLREQIDQIFLELRDLQKEIQEKIEKMDRDMFMETAKETAKRLIDKYKPKAIRKYIEAMLEEMADNLQIFMPQSQQQIPGFPVMMPEGDRFQPYQVNLLVDNSDEKGPPVIIERYPTYRNIFGSIERIVDRSGVWRTDFSKIKAGSLLKANGGYLVFNLMDAVVEPGVWQALKRALKSEQLEIQTYDPFYLFTTSGLKPEPIDLAVKVVAISDPYLYHLLLHFDEDFKKIFKVRADFGVTMDKTNETIEQVAGFIKLKTDEESLKPFDRSAVAALVEKAVRMTGRQEKISTSFLDITDLIREADYFAGTQNGKTVKDTHVKQAIDAHTYRSNRLEEQIREMMERGTLMIDTEGEQVGQVNGLAVYSMGDYQFGKPSRITASTAMGREGIINIERESDLSGNTHNKGMLILAGYLRKKYAQNKPLAVSASIAFEQSYGGVDGDSASSTEVYALLSSLSGAPLKQNIAVTGSVNQNGEIQAIGGVNEKIEGFFDCCRVMGPKNDQGVMIPQSNIKDLMLRDDVVEAVKKKKFHIYPVKTIDEGIEILTGEKAGSRKADGTYTKGSINDRVDEKLKELAEGLKHFGNNNDKKKTPRKSRTAKKKST
ncbi:MAG: ATP-binding protein [Deltaproteobacteria bacterium]|nr:ATP-binding protein [Deltaproteobacteria bacterium]